MNINLHIEKLVLDGVSIKSGEHHLLQASVESELTRSLRGGELSPTLLQIATVSRILTNDIQLTGDITAHVGLQIAQSVYGGIASE